MLNWQVTHRFISIWAVCFSFTGFKIKSELSGVHNLIRRQEKILDYPSSICFLFSTIADSRSADGLCIIYGQCFTNNKMQSAYNKQIGSTDITLFADMLPLIEGVNPDEYDVAIHQLLSKIGV